MGRLLMRYPRILAAFDRARAVAVREFPRVADVALGIDASAGTKGRAYGYCEVDGSAIVLAPRLEKEPGHRIDGVIRHEAGHAIDGKYDISTIERRLGGGLERLKPEARADEIASRLWGTDLRYDLEDVQTTGPGGPRPRYLPR